MRILTFETGLLSGEFPFVRMGEGSRRLVILPGLADALQDVRTGAWKTAWFYRNFADFSVYLIGRKRGLPAGYAIRDMAADCARAIRECLGPADVMGISMGGFIAQELAAGFPQVVRRLILAGAAHRPGPNGPELGRRWIAWAREGRWPDICREFAALTFHGRRRPLYRFLIPFWVAVLGRRPAEPQDFIVSVEACLGHDAADRLSAIRSPALVVAGTQDGFFPESLIRETARLIPGATLRLLKDAGHGAFVEQRRLFERVVEEFLL